MPKLERPGREPIYITEAIATDIARIDHLHAEHPCTKRIDWPKTATREERAHLECEALMHWIMQEGHAFRARYGRI